MPLPPTLEEDLREKPVVQALSKVGMDNYLGALPDRAAQQDYVDFYAYLHSVVDEKIGRLLAALGPPEDPTSLRSRTVILRTSDHGEMGLSHGGLRQKIFNAYEETIRVPLVVSNPRMYTEPRSSSALVSLLDVVPTFLALAGADPGPEPLDGCDLGPLLRGESSAVRDSVLFTYDDHQAGTALQDNPGQPNRLRVVRDERFKYAVYLDPFGRAAPEYEMYDLETDPLEAHNLLEVRGGRARSPSHESERRRLAERLAELCRDSGTLTPTLPRPVSSARDLIERRLAPALVIGVSRISAPARLAAARRRRRGLPGRVELFFAFDDPCSAVALIDLHERIGGRDVQLVLEPVLVRGIADDPAVEDKRRYALVDARRLARRRDSSCPVRSRSTRWRSASWPNGSPRGHRAPHSSASPFPPCGCSGSARVDPFQDRRTRDSGASSSARPCRPADGAAAVRLDERLMKRRGPYDVPAAWISGRWYFAQDRPAQILEWLDELGWRRAG